MTNSKVLQQKQRYSRMMKHFLLSASIFTIMANTNFAQNVADCMPVRDITIEETSFAENEQLTIVANYKWGIINTDVGEATMVLSTEKFRDTMYFYARAYAKTYKLWDKFFQVRDVYEGRFLTKNLRPIYFHRNINEGGYLMQNTYRFNNSNYSIIANVQRNTNPKKDTVMQGRACTYDFISLFYNSRNLEFASMTEGTIVPISFVVDDCIYDIYYRYMGKEIKKISGLGKFNCIKLAAKPVAGEVFDGKNEIYIWITDDANHVPLLIETPVVVGKVSARLSKFSGLKYPLTSKVN